MCKRATILASVAMAVGFSQLGALIPVFFFCDMAKCSRRQGGIWEDNHFTNDPIEKHYWNAMRAFHILVITTLLACMAMWMWALFSGDNKGKTVPVILVFVSSIALNATNLIWTVLIANRFGARRMDLFPEILMFSGAAFLLTIIILGLAMGLFLCADSNQNKCCGKN